MPQIFLKKSLRRDFKMSKDIISAYEARIVMVQGIVEDTRKLLEEFRQKREKMSGDLKEVLAKHKSLRKKDFDKMMEDILTAQLQREERVKQLLVDFQEQEMAVVKNLKEMLQRGKKLRIKDLEKTLAKIRREQEIRQTEGSSQIQVELAKMRSEVSAMLENFKKEREKVAAEWKSIAIMMNRKMSKK